MKKDQVLATIDTPELDSQLEASQAQLKAIRGGSDSQRGGRGVREDDIRSLAGQPKGVVSDQEREDKKARFLRAPRPS